MSRSTIRVLTKSIDVDGEEFCYIEIKNLPHYWQLKLKGEVHWSNKIAKCPYCGGNVKRRNTPIRHIHCVGMCERNYVD